MKDVINKLNNRNVILILILMLIVSLTIWGIRGTHAYYDSQTNPIPLISAKIGNFAGEGESVKNGPLGDKTSDVNIIFYAQLPDNPKKYLISKVIPDNGYKINEEVSNCYPATGGEATYSSYSILEDGTISIEYSETQPTQVVCRIYYDRDKLSDVIIYTYIQDPSGDRTFENQTYKLVNQIESNFTLVKYVCNNQATTFDANPTNGYTVTSSGPDTCYAYFKNS